MPEHEQTPKPVAPPQPQPRPALRPAETPRPANWVQALGRQPAASLFALETGAVRDEMGADESAPAADESRPAAHEDMALLPATLGPRQRAPLMIQRAADLDGLTPESDETAADAIAPAGLLVADDAASGPGQMTRSAFLAALRDAVCAGVEAELEGTLWSAMGCPYVEYWFGYYQQQSADHIERALRRYVPEASSATSAEGYIPLAVARVRRGVATWRDTGQVTEVPAGLPTNLPGLPPSAPPAAAPTNQGENDENVARKADATATPAHSPARVRQQLGPGQPLEGGVRNRMEPALGADLGRVRLHTDGKAAGLARGLGARAFAVGNHVAFGAGHYQPGTLIGDALLAHELAHVVQQSAAQTPASATSSSDERSLEDDADHTAMGAVLRLWGHARALAGRTMPALRAGLRLQSCGMSVKEKEQAAKDLLAIITDPMANEADIIKKMEALGSDGAEVLMLTPPFDHKSDDGRIRTFAGTEAGQRVLAKGTSILHNGDVVARVRADAIDKILAEFTPTTPPTVKPDEQTALDRINKAIDADSRKPEYSKSTPPLRLPVTRLNFGTEMFGGVYYNPHMSGNDAGRTRLRSLKNPETSNVAHVEAPDGHHERVGNAKVRHPFEE
nr:DUF4157 domain-containing protein [Chloroflexaceae bacterium]